MKAKKSLKNWIWEGLGLHLGGLWEGLGPLLGALGRFLAVLWAFKNQLFFKHWSKIGSKRPSGSILAILEGFWEGFEGVREGFGRIWKLLGKELEGLGQSLYLDPRADTLCVTMRGGPPPAW